MVRLTRAVVLQGISKVSIDKRDTLEIDKEFGRITHLHLQKKKITTLDSLHLFQSLTVLYLYENEISKIEGLQQAHNLEILHLQRNRIQRMENLLECKKLRKLYIGYNEIETVEGLHTLTKLEELHVEHQRLQYGASMTFDPKTLSALCNSLIFLNVSGNNLTHFEDLAGLDELHTLQASQNSVTNLDSTAIVIRTLGSLRVLDIRDNPISKKPQFKERIIGFAGNLEILNGKEISDTTRDFIQRFATVKAKRLQHAVDAYKKCTGDDSSSINGNEHAYPSKSHASAPTSEFSDSSPVMHNSVHRMTPTRSNLLLNLPPGPSHFHTFRKGFELTTPSEKSLTQISAYLSNTDINNPYKIASLPQFILAPPPSHSLEGTSGSMQEIRPRRRGSIKTGLASRRHSVSIPTFKKKMSSISEDREDPEDSNNGITNIFKTPKCSNIQDMWSRSDVGGKGDKRMPKAVVNLIKPPIQMRCSRQNFMEGMPMPSPSMLHMASSATDNFKVDTGFSYQSRQAPQPSPRLNKKNKSAPRTHSARSGESRQDMKMLQDQLAEAPPFTTSVYEHPPWPHIIKRWTTEQQPCVTFMP